jgi:hypothetical protein
MALVQLSDVIVPEVFAQYVQVQTATKSDFVQSGIMETSEFFNGLLAGGGRTFNLPHFNDLADDEPNISDDSENSATPKKLTTGSEVAQRHNVNQSWKTADLVAILAGADPATAIGNRVGAYWTRILQTRLIKTVQGVVADNEANDSGDMLKSIVVAGAGTPDATNRFNAEAFLDAAATLGDRADSVTAVSMHSVVFTRAQKNQLIDFIPDARGEVLIPTFLGRRVIVDDGMPAVTVSGNVQYSTYLFGPGAFAYGTLPPAIPAEVQREALQGNGGGTEVLVSRNQHLIHPRGFKWTDTSMAGEAATYAELASGVNWDRVVERKLVRFAELRTNG